MRSAWISLLTVTAGLLRNVHGLDATLNSVCTEAYAKKALPADEIILGLVIDRSSVSATPTHNANLTDEEMYPNAVISFCNVTFAYSHAGLNDVVHVSYWLPAPSDFQNRFLSTGGGGFAINSGNTSVAGGVSYGAASGITDGGFGSFDTQFDSAFLRANGTINWSSVYMFGYQAIYEMTVLGKAYTAAFYPQSSNSTKLYSYYQGCSEGGREGWSQVQRYGDEFDGAIIGAPAFRFSFQQVQHLYSNVVEQTLDYYPPPCELEKIMNLTIKHCDPLDGKTDGVVARTDLCKLHFNLNSAIGEPYYCAAVAAPANSIMGGGATPAQNGTVSAKAVQIAEKILDGLRDSQGKQVYLSYQPSSSFTDAQTLYDNTTDSWTLDISGIGGEWVYEFLELKNGSSLPNLDGYTYDTLKDLMIQGLHMYSDSLQTAWPDLSLAHASNTKILHFHGESDSSIPAASSVVYRESVRQIMYPGLSYNASSDALNEWYKLYLVPGGSHCSPNPYEPNGPWPQTNLAVMIDWVEKGKAPTTLNATILQGEHISQNAQICQWPLRPLWTDDGKTMECVYNQKSLDTWDWVFDGVPLPIY